MRHSHSQQQHPLSSAAIASLAEHVSTVALPSAAPIFTLQPPNTEQQQHNENIHIIQNYIHEQQSSSPQQSTLQSTLTLPSTSATTQPKTSNRKGRTEGAKGYTEARISVLLNIIEQVEPVTYSEWMEVTSQYNNSQQVSCKIFNHVFEAQNVRIDPQSSLSEYAADGTKNEFFNTKITNSKGELSIL